MTILGLTNRWNRFFHSRVGKEAFPLGAILRIGFGLVFLFDRGLLGLDLDDYFSPSHGFLPMKVGRGIPSIIGFMPSLLSLFPESDGFMWTLFWMGMFQGLLLVLGVYPRLQAFCLLLNIMSFQNHNFLFWNRQDALFRIFCLFLMFLPLNKYTVFDLLSTRTKENHEQENGRQKSGSDNTWPVWPFRLFQIQLTLMYMGLSLNKLESERWVNGDALYWMKDLNYLSGGWVELPDILFNTMFGLNLMTYLTLGLELSCWITIWISPLKTPTAVCMILFNLFVDFTMNFHCLPWLAILGWCATLFEANYKPQSLHTCGKNQGPSSRSLQSYEYKILTNTLLVVLLAFLSIDALPVQSIERILTGETSHLSSIQTSLYSTIEPALCFLGLWQEVWNLYGGHTEQVYTSMSFSAILHLDDGSVGTPQTQTETWESPQFKQMSGLQRKRLGRQMIYWTNLDNTNESESWIALVHQLAERSNQRNRGVRGTVVGVELKAHWREADAPMAPQWSWDTPVADEFDMEYTWTSLLKTKFCTDVMPLGHDSIQNSAAEYFCYDCVSQPSFVERYCRAQCEVCTDDHTEFGLQYLSFPMSEYIDEVCGEDDDDEEVWENDDVDDEDDDLIFDDDDEINCRKGEIIWDEDDPSFVFYRNFDPAEPLNLSFARRSQNNPIDTDAGHHATTEREIPEIVVLGFPPKIGGSSLWGTIPQNHTSELEADSQQQQAILKSV